MTQPFYPIPTIAEPKGDEIPHQAAEGYPGLTIVHPEFTCSWCDAERYRLCRRTDLAELTAVMAKLGFLEPPPGGWNARTPMPPLDVNDVVPVTYIPPDDVAPDESDPEAYTLVDMDGYEPAPPHGTTRENPWTEVPLPGMGSES